MVAPLYMLYITCKHQSLFAHNITYIIAIHRVVFAEFMYFDPCGGTGLVPQSDAAYHINWQLHSWDLGYVL